MSINTLFDICNSAKFPDTLTDRRDWLVSSVDPLISHLMLGVGLPSN